MLRPFRQVDVFTSEPYRGNPLAVVLAAEGLSDEAMRQFANWTNLSETAFVLPPSGPGADYRVRIFTPGTELLFAGHPTLGSCHAWLEAGGQPAQGDIITQECGAGLIRIRREPGGLAFAAPPLVRGGPVDEPLLERIAAVLGIARADIVDASWADNGPGWVAVLLASAQAVLALRAPRAGFDLGVVGAYPPGSPCAFEVRAFAGPAEDPVEDPVTGSLNAAIAPWLLRTGRASVPYVVSQGTALGRSGRVRVSRDGDGTIWVGGSSVTCLTGHAEL